MEITKIIFFSIIFLTIYSYAIYPLILVLLSTFINRKLLVKDETPFITLIISAYNEEDVLLNKIENTLDLNYPADKLEILIVSDHSTDSTDEIVKSYSDQGVILLSSNVRRGKTAGLNEAVAKAKGDIIVFSDADAMYSSNVLEKMARLLSDPSVGLVTGSTAYLAEGDGKMVQTSGIYTRLERLTKIYESKIGSCVGADGAVFAIRKSLYTPLNDDDINDLVIPLKVVQQGYRVVIGDDIYCYEAASKDLKSEFSRQIRITNRTLLALFRNIELINSFKYPLFSFKLISHKFIRFSIPFFLLILLPMNYFLFDQGFIYKLTMLGQVVFYTLALLGFILESRNYNSNKFSFIYHFIMIQLSILFGWYNFIIGKKQVTWNPRN